jgi:hypothetical protein
LSSPSSTTIASTSETCTVANQGNQLQRPQMRAIQRVSSESVNRSCSSTGSVSSASDSGDVLALRRDELVSHILHGEEELARRPSRSPSASPTVEATTIDTPILVNPSLTLDQVDCIEDTELRSSVDEASIHAWDSVVSHDSFIVQYLGLGLVGLGQGLVSSTRGPASAPTTPMRLERDQTKTVVQERLNEGPTDLPT